MSLLKLRVYNSEENREDDPIESLERWHIYHLEIMRLRDKSWVKALCLYLVHCSGCVGYLGCYYVLIQFQFLFQICLLFC